MAQVVRARLYLDSLKIGVVMRATLTWNKNREQMDADGGVIAASKGNDHIELQFDQVIVTPGSPDSNKALDALAEGSELSAAFATGGKQWSTPMVVNVGVIESENKSGVVTGKFTLINSGNPEVL